METELAMGRELEGPTDEGEAEKGGDPGVDERTRVQGDTVRQ